MILQTNEWWKPIESCFTGVDLKGLKIVCPECKEKGLVITRWVKGPKMKPVYIMHLKWRKARRVCGLTEKQTESIRGKVSVLESDIKRLLMSRKAFILFSGGMDSLATLVYLRKLAKQVHRNLTAVHADTTAGLPANTDYVKKVCGYLEVDLKIVKPKVDYFTLVRKWGIPSFRYRWCCRELKIKPIKEYLETVSEPKVVFDGIRAAESRIRKEYIPIWYHPSFKCLSVSSIFHWSNEEVTSFLNNDGIPKTFLSSLGTSTECWCGAYKTEEDFEMLYGLDKDMFHKLAEVEEESNTRYTFLYKKGKKIPLADLERKIQAEGSLTGL
jgi:3'-phosphoadenosine 5'-phosphosulfate sulfotransferase (PAPS reductase)/FAD synthetase